MYPMLIASSVLPVVFATLHRGPRDDILRVTRDERHIDHRRSRGDGSNWLRGCQKPVQYDDYRFLVDRAQFVGGKFEDSVDVTDVINELIVKNGICNVAGGMRLQELPSELAAFEDKKLLLSNGPHHIEFEPVSGNELNIDAHELFDDVRGTKDVLALSGQYIKLDYALLVHYAVFRRADHGVEKTVDVRDEINRLIALNGLHDFTGGASLVSLFGDKSLGLNTILRLGTGSRYMALHPGRESIVYDLRPLFMESLYVEEARYTSIKQPELSVNTTAEVNQLLTRDGADNITRGRLLDMFPDPAPGQAKLLQVTRGGRTMEIKVPFNGGHLDRVDDLMPLFLATGAIRAQKLRRSTEGQPSVFVAVMSRRSSMVRRKNVRDMWQRVAGTSTLATVRFAVCSK